MSEAGKKTEKNTPEVSEKATRRRLTQAYKEQILAEADQCTQPGELGELLRRRCELVLSRPMELLTNFQRVGVFCLSHPTFLFSSQPVRFRAQ